MKIIAKAALGLVLALSTSACATTYSITPVGVAEGDVRYERGQATTSSQKANGAVRVTPIGVGPATRLNFGVAAFNRGDRSANFGTENITVAVEGQPVRVFSFTELERQAKNAATAAQVVAAIGGVAAAYDATQDSTSTTTSTVRDSRGRYVGAVNTTTTSSNSGLEAANAVVIVAATGATLATINRSLNETLDALNGSILQTTTIDPGSTYGGQVVTDKVPLTRPVNVTVTVNFAGERHQFRFRVAAVAP